MEDDFNPFLPPWVLENRRPRIIFAEVQFDFDAPDTSILRFSIAKLARASPFFLRFLREEFWKPYNMDAAVFKVTCHGARPGIMKRVLWWVDTGELQDSHTLAQYANDSLDDALSPWMSLVRMYDIAIKFEMLSLQNAIMYKLVEKIDSTGRVPCGTLKYIYGYTKPGDGLRRLMINITASMASSAVYRVHFSSWNREIMADLLIALKDAPKIRLCEMEMADYIKTERNANLVPGLEAAAAGESGEEISTPVVETPGEGISSLTK